MHVVDNRPMVITSLEEKPAPILAGKKYPMKKLYEKEFVGYRCRHLNYLKEYTTSIFSEFELKPIK